MKDQGQVLVLATVSMIALMGIMALTLDASYMYAKRNVLHSAADSAAKSGAVEVIRNPTVSQASLEAFADQQVAAHGFAPSRQGGTTIVVVNRPPTSGPFAGASRYVEVIVSEPTSTFFATILGWASMTPTASAIAGASNPWACLITRNNLSIGNTQLTLNGCNVGVGNNLIGGNPNAEILGTPTPAVGVVGNCSGTCSGMGTLTTGAPAPNDPLLGLAIPTMPAGVCSAGAAATLNPGCYSSIEETVTTLNSGPGGAPGIYYVTGPVRINNLSGTNVMIFLAAGGNLVALQNKSIVLSGPTSGSYTGIAIFQDPANSNNFSTQNSFSLAVNGAIYMPGADVVFNNALDFVSTGCTLFIAKSLSINNGSGSMSNTGCVGTFGGALFLSATIAQ